MIGAAFSVTISRVGNFIFCKKEGYKSSLKKSYNEKKLKNHIKNKICGYPVSWLVPRMMVQNLGMQIGS